MATFGVQATSNVPYFLLINLPFDITVTMKTTPQQILDIEDALVSDDNPARDDGALDYERCARLHNYLVAYGWMARNGRDTPDLDALASEKWFFQEANGGGRSYSGAS
jgi:hypothetical protein